MKKLLALLSGVLVLAFLATSCSANVDEGSSSSTSDMSSTSISSDSTSASNSDSSSASTSGSAASSQASSSKAASTAASSQTTASVTSSTPAASSKPVGTTLVTLVYGSKSMNLTTDSFALTGMGQQLKTTDPNMSKQYTFVGITLKTMATKIGATGAKTCKIISSDNMVKTVAMSDLMQYPIMIATSYIDGKAISSGAGGPAKIEFPIDDYPGLLTTYPATTWNWWVIKVEFSN